MSHLHPTAGPSSSSVRRAVAVVLAPLLIALAVGTVLLWPSAVSPIEQSGGASADRVRGTVVSIEPCGQERAVCPTAEVELGGSTAPRRVTAVLPFGTAAPAFEPGDRLVLSHYPDAPEGQQYQYIDFDRRAPLAALVVGFALVVIAFARWRGVASLLSLGFTLVVFTQFLLPGLRSGQPPVALALVAAGLIMTVTLYVGHGPTAQTSVALLGTLVSLTLTAALGYAVIAVADFTGQADDYSITLGSLVGAVDVRGLVLAGLVIGALGVLDDVTVTQTAVVWELRASDPAASSGTLLRAGMRVGRAHVQATVNTLVLAYLGASLPLFIILSLFDVPLLDTLVSEPVAQEIISGMVGSIGIVAAVPLTTAIAVAVARGAPRHRADA